MAALLVALSVMAIAMTVAMPVWKQSARREKEAELVFRGQQWVRAIGLYQRKTGPGALPPNLDLLVEQRFIRKKYKDPITNDDFLPLTQAQAAAATQPAGSGATGARGGTGSGTGPGTSGTTTASTTQAGRQGGAASATPGGPQGSIIGVVSKSKDQSIRLYNGRSHYNEWAFVFTAPAAAPGGAPGTGPGRGQQPPGTPSGPLGPGRGGRGTGPGGRGGPGGPGRGGPQSPILPTGRGRGAGD